MKWICLIIFWMLTGSASSQQLEITITEIRNNKGSVRLAFYNSAESFDKDQPALFYKVVSKSALNEGVVHVTYNGLPPGTYGIALLDDENENRKMDYRFFMPVEGFGFSNYYHTGMTRPRFEKFKFELGRETLRIQIKVRYL